MGSTQFGNFHVSFVLETWTEDERGAERLMGDAIRTPELLSRHDAARVQCT